MLRKTSRPVPCALCLGGMTLLAGQAYALTIIPIFNAEDPNNPDGKNDSTIASDTANAGTIEATIQSDINALDSDIANPLTITVYFSESSSGLADSNSDAFYAPTYADYLNALETKQSLSTADKLALSSLGVTAPYSTPAPGTGNPVNGNTEVGINGNLYAALGANATTGGYVEINNSIINDSRTNPVVGRYDLQSAVAHELDEVLGIGGAGSNLNSVATGFDGTTLASPVRALDLYRYSASGVRSYSTSNRVSSYFSIDGGNTTLVHFNQNGAYVPPGGKADNSDFGDWGDGVVPSDGNPNTPAQVQDAYGGPYDGSNDTFSNLGPNEVTALDVVGWDLTNTGSILEESDVPEPTCCGLLVVGVIGALGRRRRSPR
jgi:hypothetical protein